MLLQQNGARAVMRAAARVKVQYGIREIKGGTREIAAPHKAVYNRRDFVIHNYSWFSLNINAFANCQFPL